ncbi:MAG: carboxypeptidase-like regulatory domain-containing protein [Isosphaeraceae bacterium]
MGSQSAGGLGRWRETSRPRPGSDRNRISATKWLGSATLAALLLFVAGVVSWIAWQFIRPREIRPDFIAFSVSRFRDPQVPDLPQAEADQERIRQATFLSPTDGPDANREEPTLEVIQRRLERLRQKKADDAVVVYLSTHAVVDEAGDVQLLARDSDPYAPRTQLPLKTVLDGLRGCPARKKLLVLDVMPEPGYLLDLGATEDAVGDLISRELARPDESGKVDDGSLAVLVPCSVGEFAAWSEQLGQSVFGHFFVKGLTEPGADSDTDRAVSVRELADYLTTRVDAWTLQHLGMRQRPMLIGSTGELLLASLNRRKAETPEEPGDAAKTAAGNAPAEPAESPEGKAKADQKADAAGKKQAEGKEKQNQDAEPEKAKPAVPQPAYPAWLAAGWELRERWAAGPELALAPRLFRILEAHLLRSDREWRLGKGAEGVRTANEKVVADLTARMEQMRQEKRPPEGSIGQAIAFGKRADEALLKGLGEILEQERRPDPQLNPDQRKAKRAEMIGGLIKGLKDKTSLDLALAIDEAARSSRLGIDTVQLLDSIVAGSLLPRNIVELRLLQQLAERSRRVPPKDWDDELARKIWDTVVLAEKANNRPRAFPWVRGLLEEADVLRHEAEVRLLPGAIGFSSPGRLARSWDQVAAAYALIDGCQSNIAEAQRAAALARAALPASLHYLETIRPDRSGPWLDAARTVQALEELLERRGTGVESSPLTRDQLLQLNGSLADTTQQLKAQLTSLLRPFAGDSVKRLIGRCRENVPEPQLGGEVEAVLATPFLSPADRQELWRASLDLHRRLGEMAVRDGGSDGAAGGPSSRLAAVTELAERRKQRLRTLLKLADPRADLNKLDAAGGAGGGPSKTDQEKRTEEATVADQLARSWGALSRLARAVHSRIAESLQRGARDPGEDRPAWVAPALSLDEARNPIRIRREREDLAAWTWLASRYRHENHDLQGLMDPSAALFETLSLQCPGESGARQDPTLRLSIADSSKDALRLSPRRPSTDVEIRIVLEDGRDGGVEKVNLAALDPDDRRLTVSAPQPADLDLASAASTPVRLNLRWDESRAESSTSPPAGIIVQARLASGRAFHLLVPVEIVTDNALPRLALRTDPAVPVDVPLDPFRLRTLPGRQPFFVVVKNPSSVDRKVVVEILSGETVVATSADKDRPALDVKAGSTVQASFGEPAATAKPTDPLPEAPPKLSLRLRDAGGDQQFDRQELRPAIAAPLEYLELVRAQFVPRRPGEANRLEVTLRALPQMTAPNCPVRLDIPADPDLFPAFVEPPRGNLERLVEPGGKPVTLIAEDIKLNATAPEEGKFSVSVDGAARALWYQTRFVLEGQAQKVEPVRRARIRFQPEYSVASDRPARLIVRFKVDNAPRDARLQFRLGHHEGKDFKDDIKHWSEQAQKRHIGFDPRGKGGTLLFEASVEDWVKEFDVPGIRGKRYLYAYLLDARERVEIDRWGTELVLDDVSPVVAELTAPEEIEPTATRLPVKATVRSSESRIKDVAFIINPGAKGDFSKAEAENKIIPGKPSAGDRETWEANLPVPKGAGGKLVVSARATTGAGLSAMAHCEVVVKEPPPEPPPAAAKAAEEKPGAIVGKVTENDVAQPGLTVYLIDPNAKEKENPVKGTASTAADGTYSFPELKAGPYRLLCLKQATNRRDTKDVDVKSGETVKQNLDLMLP